MRLAYKFALFCLSNVVRFLIVTIVTNFLNWAAQPQTRDDRRWWPVVAYYIPSSILFQVLLLIMIFGKWICIILLDNLPTIIVVILAFIYPRLEQIEEATRRMEKLMRRMEKDERVLRGMEEMSRRLEEGFTSSSNTCESVFKKNIMYWRTASHVQQLLFWKSCHHTYCRQLQQICCWR